MTLTPAQIKALRLASEGDLVCWRGGFWALAGEPVSHRTGGADVPRRWTQAGTIYALDRKGALMEMETGSTHPWSGPRRITDAGKAALQSSKA